MNWGHGRINNLLDLLEYRSNVDAAKLAFTYLVDGEREGSSITYSELHQMARRIGGFLQQEISFGDRVILLYPPGLEFIKAFFGCIYSGAIPVIVHPPDPYRLEQTFPIFQAIMKDADSSLILTSSEFPVKDTSVHRWIETDLLSADPGEKWHRPEIHPDNPAVLQYTSGSTSSPKGIILSHANILNDLELIQSSYCLSDMDRTVFWVPYFHNVGLITEILGAVYSCVPSWMMSPLSFLEKPSRWLTAISKYRATISVAPNFAYQLCARIVPQVECDNLDLSCWKMACTGGEPVSEEALIQFTAKFAPYGFTMSAFKPGYGLGECTSVVSATQRERTATFIKVDREKIANGHIELSESDGYDAKTLIGCGTIPSSLQIKIVNPETFMPASLNEIGEIWISGPVVAKGYWRRPKETTESFEAYLSGTDEGPFFRTGDLATIYNNELFICGRLKDLIIIRGKNYYPQDIEKTVAQCHSSIRPYSCAAFSVEVDGQERLVIVVEVERRSSQSHDSSINRRKNPTPPPDPMSVDGFDADMIVASIRGAVSEYHKLQVYGVVLIKPGSMEQTVTRKVRRSACRQRFLLDNLDPIKIDFLNNASF